MFYVIIKMFIIREKNANEQEHVSAQNAVNPCLTVISIILSLSLIIILYVFDGKYIRSTLFW